MPTQSPIDIWSMSLLTNQSEFVDFKSILSDTELQRANRFHNIDHQQRAIVSAAKLRIILARYLQRDPRDIVYQLGSHGKPFIENFPLHFNMSHSADQCVIAVSRDAPLGIDVEHQRDKIDIHGLIRKVLTENEQRNFSQLSPT
ncbi:MAG: hypothetical protein M3R00_09310, partial [Pseudomonadota bacterium]|nr:hypothetical protein [Pseudomonadota bacterium]